MTVGLDTDMIIHEHWMREALSLAEQAGDADEVPVGAVIVQDGDVIGRGINQPIRTCDPTAHAEIVAIRSASQFCSNYRLPGTTLYVTIEPCTMCLGAMVHARVDRLIFGATEPRAGAVVSHSSSPIVIYRGSSSRRMLLSHAELLHKKAKWQLVCLAWVRLDKYLLASSKGELIFIRSG